MFKQIILPLLELLFLQMIKLIGQSEQPALVGKNISITYNQLLARIGSYSSLLREMNSQRIVIFSENRPEWIYALYAGWKKGAIIVPVDVLLTRGRCCLHY